MVETNMRVLRSSRVKPRPGDIFVYQMPDGLYSFGRLITDDTFIRGMKGCILVYAFNGQSKEKSRPSRKVLKVDNLMIPPILINRLPWSRGYFETIDNLPLMDDEVLARHCFRDLQKPHGYFDEKTNEMASPVGPVGRFALGSFLTFDDEVSEALGFPLMKG